MQASRRVALIAILASVGLVSRARAQLPPARLRGTITARDQ